MTPPYDLLVTAVAERSDLFVECIASLLAHVDQLPARIIVNEDVRPGTPPERLGQIEAWLKAQSIPHVHQVRDPAQNMGPATLWCFDRAAERPDRPIALYTQEDWEAVRPIPIRRALALMEAHGLHHVRFNKRKTMKAKHADKPTPWRKVEVRLPVPPDGPVAEDNPSPDEQVLCISDHWYTQTSLWRVAEALPNLRAAAEEAPAVNPFVGAFNRRMNAERGDGRAWDDQTMRHERLRTYIWGPVGEPPFIRHMGSRRGTGVIVDHVLER